MKPWGMRGNSPSGSSAQDCAPGRRGKESVRRGFGTGEAGRGRAREGRDDVAPRDAFNNDDLLLRSEAK